MIRGIFLLDKPLGISSNLALQKVKRLFKEAENSASIKAGHTGSLDPLATGLLPICFGEATKFSQFLLDADKTYAVTMQLGVRTTSSDAEGEIVATREVPNFSQEDIDRACDFFRGKTQQIPSMFSALKHQGVPLYEYARKGMIIPRQSRPIMIYALTLQSLQNHFISFTVKCSKGTYVRTLVDDLGEKLGCGAHVTQLRRLSVGPFVENQMMTIEQLSTLLAQQNFFPESLLLPVDTAVQHWPVVTLPDALASRVQQGQTVVISEVVNALSVRLQNSQGKFLGVGDIAGGRTVIPKRLVQQQE